MDRDNLDLTEQIDGIHIVRQGHETAACCRMVLGEEGLAVSLNTKMLLMNGKFMSKTYYQTRMFNWNEGDALYQPKYEHE